MTHKTLDDLRDDLNRAYEQNVVSFFHIGKVSTAKTSAAEIFYEDSSFDVYVALKSEYMNREDHLKMYMRKTYGHLIRVLAVEQYG